MCAIVQSEALPVGRVEVTTFPALLTATQSDVDGHDTPGRPTAPRADGPGSISTDGDQDNG